MKPPKHSSYQYLANLIPSLAIALAIGLGVSLHPTLSTVAYAKHSSHAVKHVVKHKYENTEHCIRLVGEIDASESVAVKLQFLYKKHRWVTKKQGNLTKTIKRICYTYDHANDTQAADLKKRLRVIVEPGKGCKAKQKAAGIPRHFRIKRKSKSDSWVCHVVKIKKTKTPKHI